MPARGAQVDQVGGLGSAEDQHEGVRRAQQRGARAGHKGRGAASFRDGRYEGVCAGVEVVVEAQTPLALHSVLSTKALEKAGTYLHPEDI